jgi:hypothetical protein
VYLVTGFGHLLPDMVVSLSGDGGLHFALDGRVDSIRGGMRATFETLPDAPASKFELTLFGGKRGLLENSANVCAEPLAASGRFVGQNNTGLGINPILRGDCKKHRKGHGRKRRKH